MRDFAVTPEPAGEVAPSPPAGGAPRFVIQEHDATRLHWDLRLEHEGVLPSWALTRGVPWSPDDDRLAVHTEDHPTEYLEFHGEIPAGEYGAGTMRIFDRGTYEPLTFRDDEVVVRLAGERVTGRYALFPLRDRDWMIHRMDPPQDPERRPMPGDLLPMEAVEGSLPTGEDWAFEIRWTGERILIANDAGHVDLTGRRGDDVSSSLPELRRIGRELAAVEAILDAVVVAVDREGRPTGEREAVTRRLQATQDSRVRRLARDTPVAAMIVDLLWLQGHPTNDLSYAERRELLAELALDGTAWATPAHHRGDGGALLGAAGAQGLAGLVAKRLASPYAAGSTSDDWVLVPAS